VYYAQGIWYQHREEFTDSDARRKETCYFSPALVGFTTIFVVVEGGRAEQKTKLAQNVLCELNLL